MAKNYTKDVGVQDRALDHVKQSFKVSENFQNRHFEEFVKYRKLYRGVQDTKSYSGRANLFVPEIFANIEAKHARITRSYRGVAAKPQAEDDVGAAEAAEMLLDYQERIYGYKKVFSDMCKDALIYGNSFAKVSWKVRSESEMDYPDVESVDPLDYFFDPDVVNRHQTSWEIHRIYRTKEELEKDPRYFNTDDLVEGSKSRIAGSSRKNARLSSTGISKRPQQSKKVELLEFWGLFDPDEKGEPREFLITIADQTRVIRLEENPYVELLADFPNPRPFVHMQDINVPHEFYAMSSIEMAVKLQEELNDTRNQRMDNVTMVIDRMWVVPKTAGVDENDLIRRPGGIIRPNVPGQIEALNTPDVTQSAYNEEEIIKRDLQKAMGVPDIATGELGSLQGEAVATILAVQESGNVIFDKEIANFADAVRATFALVLAFDQKWMDKKQVVRLEGEKGMEFKEITKDNISGRMDIDVAMETQMNKIVSRQEAINLYQILAQNPMINQQVNTRTLLESMDRKNIEELMDTPPPAPKPPEEPSKRISVNLKGDLNSLESDDIAVIMGAKPESADPILREDTRMLMKGIFPEDRKLALEEAKIQEKLIEEQRLAGTEAKNAQQQDRKLDIEEKKTSIAGNKEIANKAKSLLK